MKEKVYFIPSRTDDDAGISTKVANLITGRNLLGFVKENDFIALKTHFGEGGNSGWVRPVHVKTIGELIMKKNAFPFLTETSTLYKGHRNNAVSHIALAHRHGFGYEKTGLPLIMSDGLIGDEETEVKIPGRIYTSVKIARMLAKVQGFIAFTHFTGHLGTGFGAALKNIGMGCASRKGKMVQHSTMKPKIDPKLCTLCGECEKWCPAVAISLGEESAVIDRSKCIGCGQCLAVCRFDAVKYNWGASYADLQKKVVEHAFGVASLHRGRMLFLNYLTRISKDCDCMSSYEQVAPDIGVLISRDPVAVDAASIDLVEKTLGKKFAEVSYNIPYRIQIEYSREIGFGSPDYELEEVL